MTVAKLAAHATAHQFGLADLDWSTPIDREKYFVCPTMSSLYYTPTYATLTGPQKLRYNHIFGLASNELVGLFERSLSIMLSRLAANPRVPQEMRDLLPAFLADEDRHADIWWKLNQLAAPERYEQTERRIITPSAMAHVVYRTLSARPTLFPVTLWTALLLEEHALQFARRAATANVPLEPRFVAAYRLHAQDEARHVQIDWLMLDFLLSRLSRPMLALNVRLFRSVVDRFFLRPVRAGVQIAQALVAECPELAPRLPAMAQELENLSTCPAYREMIFSPRSKPVTFGLIERFDRSGVFGDLT